MNNHSIFTTKCSAFHHPEFFIVFDPAIPQPDIESLISFLEESVQGGTQYTNGDLITYGSMLLRVVETDNYLMLEEPDLRSLPIEWIPGASQSIKLLRLQRDIAESIGLENEITPPSIRWSLLVGADLTQQNEDLILDRVETDDSDSGWFVGNGDTVLDYNDEANLSRISVYQAILNWPQISGFLALPAGCRVDVSDAKPVFTRNDRLLEIKPGSFLDVFIRHSQAN